MNMTWNFKTHPAGWRTSTLAAAISSVLLFCSVGVYGEDGDGNVFRRNVSRTPNAVSAKAKLGYSQSAYADAVATDADSQGVVVIEPTTDEDGNLVCGAGYLSGEKCVTQPLVVTYTDAGETYAAVSLDDGATWKRNNLSHTTDKIVSLETVDEAGNPLTLQWQGYTKKPVLGMVGRKILVAWTSNLCRGGSTGLQDGNAGDETGVGDPDDYYQVNGRQGYVDYSLLDRSDLGKEAFQCIWTARGVVETDGTVTWRAPERLTSGRRDAYQLSVAFSSPGFTLAWQEDPEGLQPGEMAGPGHGMSGATVSKKTDIWYSYLPGGAFVDTCDDCFVNGDLLGIGDGKPKVATLFSSPVPVSDNAPCQLEVDANGDLVLMPDGVTPLVHGAPICSGICKPDDLAEVKVNGRVACMKDGVALDGDTGASRPNIFMVGSEVAIGYEETKGLGGGPNEDPNPEEADDTGKDVLYHYFGMTGPNTQHPGYMVNLPELDKTGKPVVTEDGVVVRQNARRVRFVKQSGSPGESGTTLALLYREGPDGKGRQADIMMRRMVGGYRPENLVCTQEWAVEGNNGTKGDKICILGAQNLSSPQYLQLETDTEGGTPKVLSWKYNEYNLDDTHKDNPYDDARAHRGILRGDFLMVGYTWTPNWAAARNGKDTYDFYVRRSFTGGRDITDLKGQFEDPKNLSRVRDNLGRHLTIIEPRLIATPSTYGGLPKNPDDTQNRMIVFASYGTATNPDLDYGDPVPQDLYYSWTDNLGATYREVYNENSGRWEFDWLANSTPNNGVQAGEAQLRTNPAGTRLFATWLAESDVAGPCANGQPAGSDICFRRIDGVGPFSRYDLNGDGKLDWDDEQLLNEALVKYSAAADFDQDGKVDKTNDLVLWNKAVEQYCLRPDAREDSSICP